MFVDVDGEGGSGVAARVEKGQNEINVRAEARNRKGWRRARGEKDRGDGRQAKFAQRSYKRRAVGMREKGGMFPDKTKVQLEGSANVRGGW